MSIPSQDWQVWRIIWDRTPSDWRAQTITWYMNGQQFQQLSGNLINDQAVWNSLAASPMFFILNVAVGGSWVSVFRVTVQRSWVWDRMC